MDTTTYDPTELAPDAAGFDIRHLTESQFAELGVSFIAYVKPVVIEGKSAFAIHAANGMPMALTDNRDRAVAAIVEHEMQPTLVH